MLVALAPSGYKFLTLTSELILVTGPPCAEFRRFTLPLLEPALMVALILVGGMPLPSNRMIFTSLKTSKEMAAGTTGPLRAAHLTLGAYKTSLLETSATEVNFGLTAGALK